MPPLKIKLSLSGASLSSVPPSTPQNRGEESITAGVWGQGQNAAAIPPVLAAAAGPSTPHSISSTGKTSASKVKARVTPAKPPKPKGKIGRPPKNRPSAATSAPARPSAIPAHVYSAGPSTPLSSPLARQQMAPPPPPSFPFPSTPSPAPESRYTSQPTTPSGVTGDDEGEVKQEPRDGDEEDGDEASPDPLSTPLPLDDGHTPVASGSRAKKTVRYRKPLRELLGKILVELRRRDEYALFSEPVNTDDFPTYLDTIGGEEKMMDLSTMQSKLDNGEYRHLDEAEADLRLLVTAAQTFNPAGTVPHRSAGNVLFYGLKQIERSRALVLTPSPSPTRESATPWRGDSADVDADPNSAEARLDIPPERRIPEEMLSFPPNSLPARAVAWNLTGGKRVYIKRELRARERFTGKWRHFDLDGTRTLAEMDDILEVLAPAQAKASRVITDWAGLAADDGWWDWPGVGGPSGQAPAAFTKYPIRPVLRTRELEAKEWGVYPEMEAREATEPTRYLEILADHLRPTASRAKTMEQVAVLGKKEPAKNPPYVNTYDARPAGAWLRDMQDGDVRGEAYRTSVKRFLDGAVKGATSAKLEATSGTVKTEQPTPPVSHESGDVGDHGLEQLEEYVEDGYHGGMFSSSVDVAARRALASLARTSPPPLQSHPSIKAHGAEADTASLDATTPTNLLAPAQAVQIARSAHARRTMRHILRPANALDISPLIKEPEEFLLLGKHGGMRLGLEWVGTELQRLNDARPQRAVPFSRAQAENSNAKEMHTDSPSPAKKPRTHLDAGTATAASSPLSTAPPSPPAQTSSEQPEPDKDKGAMNDLRLELLALCKWFPLTGLKPLSKALADKVLPVGVRALLTAAE